MEDRHELENFVKLPTFFKNLEIYVKDSGGSRKIRIIGDHVMPRGPYHCPYSEFETILSLETLTKIALKKGRYFREEIERSENPNYLQRKIEIMLKEFGIALSGKKVLDFGCGAGASTAIFLRCGATDIIGVDVDESLLDIARSRLSDFFQTGYQFIKIDYVDGKYSMPFLDEEFDIVWAQAILEHVLPRQRKFVLREMWRVLKRGGTLIIFGTPNRLWVKEYHTSNLYFVNYLPIQMAIPFVQWFSRRVPNKITKEELLLLGFRGVTYWEITRALPNAICLNNVLRKKDLFVGIQSWKGDSESALRRKMLDLYGNFMGRIDPLLAFLKLPQTAFLPSHSIVLQK